MPSLIIRLLEALAPLGEVEDRPHLGGWALYLKDRMFAVVQGERIWFRTDHGTRLEYMRSGSGPFATNPSMELGWFYEVPASVRDDEYQLVAWARKAVEAK
ncbi:MAG TPA: TfoX/Sxy family protein [Candidatus Dormibacteraeota bacterium]